MKNFYNSGSDIFKVLDRETNFEYHTVKVDRKSNHRDVIQVGKKVYRIVGVHAMTNEFSVYKLDKFNFRPEIVWTNNNVFHCPYCNKSVVRDDDYGLCLTCRSKSIVEKIAVTSLVNKFIDTPHYEVNRFTFKLLVLNKQIHISNRIIPLRRGIIKKYDDLNN